MSRTGLAVGGGLVTALAWGGMFAVAQSAFDTIDPFRLTAARFVIASVVLMVVLAAKEGPSALLPSGRLGALWLTGTLGFAGFNLLVYAGLERSTPQVISLVMATVPMVTLFVMWIRTGRRPHARVFAFAVVAVVGIAMVLGDGNPAAVLDAGVGAGAALAFAGVVAWVVYTTSRGRFGEMSLLRFTTLTCMLGSMSVVVIAWVLARGRPPLSMDDLVSVSPQILYMALPATVVAVLTWNHAVAVLGASNGVLFMNLVPLTAFGVEWVRGSHTTGGQVVGAIVTVGALLATNIVMRRTSAPGSPPSSGSSGTSPVRDGRAPSSRAARKVGP